jgi:selenocysteine-specific translation elongation factor
MRVVKLESLYILYTNADSLMNKRRELIIGLNDLNFKPLIIAVGEVKN